MMLNQERPYRQSSFCQICQNNFDYDKHLSTSICKSNHVVCSTCAGQIVRKDPRCPFCRDRILYEVRSKYKDGEVDADNQFYQPLLPGNDHRGRDGGQRVSDACYLIGATTFFFLVGTGCLIAFLNLRSCSIWGDYNVTCYNFDEFYCCQREDGTCPNNYRECDYLYGQNTVLSIFEYGALVFYGVGLMGIWQLLKKIPQRR